jgi:predicted nucleic acid-binding protein
MRQLVLQQTEASFDPLPFDALIAATALAHNLPLYTRNAKDFEGIDGLDLRPVTPNI